MVYSSTNLRLSILFLVNNRKNKCMRNSISKVNKDHFFAFKEFMKNDFLFSKGKAKFVPDMGTRGTCVGVFSMRKLPGVVEKPLSIK